MRAYLGYLRDRPDSVVAALRDAARADGAAIVHCAAGKDRTGVVAALALAVAGAPRDAIVADYVATGERLEPIVARLRASPTYGADLRGRTLDSHRPRAETMERFLECSTSPTTAPAAGSPSTGSATRTPGRCASGSPPRRAWRRAWP